MCGGSHSRKLLVASAAACAGLLMFAGLSMSDLPAGPAFHPKEGEVVAILSKRTNKFLEVSAHDGRLRATADGMIVLDAVVADLAR